MSIEQNASRSYFSEVSDYLGIVPTVPIDHFVPLSPKLDRPTSA